MDNPVFIQTLYFTSLILNMIILGLLAVNFIRHHKDRYNQMRLLMFLFNIAMTLHIIGLIMVWPLFAAVTVFVLTAIGFLIFIKDYI